MSTTIDNKVVSMEFNNKNFEKNVKQSMSTIDKLKKKLKFDKAAQDFDKLDKAAQKVRFDTMGHGIDSVKMKLSALDVFAVTAFHRMSDAAITTGKNLVKSFTIDPIKTGLQEYETQINAVQTILANTSHQGTTIKDVNAALDELNHYADMTIYNFTEMTRNIGTFTAAGLDLDTSVKGIQGIANLAAVSGSNAQQASTAMYQLSQALAAGTVHLQDWNSVVNAGMGGKVFQDAIIQTAKEMGALNKATLDAYESGVSFRELLNPAHYGNWFSSDVLATTLGKFTKSGAVEYLSKFANVSQTSLQELQNLGDKVGYNSKEFEKMALSITGGNKAMTQNITSTLQMASTATDAATKVKTFTQLMDTLKEAAQSGWTKTWQLIIGDFEEAKSLFTEASDYLSNIINESANKRNNLVQGAMQNLVSSQDWNALEKAGVATKAFKNALIETAEANGVAVKQMIKDNGSFEETLKNGWLNADILSETLSKNEKQLSKSTLKMSKSLKEYFKIANQVMKGSWGRGKKMQEALTKAGYDYAQVQNLINGMTKYGAKSFEKMCLQQLKSEGVTKKQAKALVQLGKYAEKAGTPMNELMQKMYRPSGRELLIDTIRKSVLSIIKPFKAAKQAWNEIFPPTTSEQLYGIINSLHEFSVKLYNIDKDGSKLTRTFKGVFSIVKLFTTLIGGGAKIALNVITGLLSHFNLDILSVTASIGDAITAISNWITENNILIKVAQLLGVGIAMVIEKVYELAKSIAELPKVQNGIEKVSKAFDEFVSTINKFKDDPKKNIEEFVKILKSINDLTLEDAKNMIDSFKNTVIEYANKVREKLGKNGIIGPLLTIGSGILIIKTIKTLGNVFQKFEEIIGNFSKPFKAIGDALEGLKPVLKAYSFELKSEAMLNIAKSIAVLAASIFLISRIEPAKLAMSAGALTIMAGALTGLCFVIGKFNIKDIGKISTGMLALSSSILILVIGLKKMDSLNPDNILRNLGIIGSLIGGLTLFTKFSGKIQGLDKNMLSIVAFAVALRILVNTLYKLDGMSFDNLGRDLVALFGLVVMLTKISKVVGNVKFTSGAGLILVVVSLRMFIKALASISTIDYGSIKSNLGSIITILGTFCLVILASNKAGKYAAKAGVMIMSVSLSMIIIVKAIKKMNELSEEDLSKAKKTISELLLVFGAVIALSNFAGENALKAGGMILMMSAALLPISVVAAILSKLDPDGLKRATASISILIGCFSLLVAASGLSEDCHKNLIVMTTAIGLIAISVGALSLIDPEHSIEVTLSLATLMSAFALMIASTHFSKESTKELIIMVGMIGLLGTIIAGISKLGIDDAMEVSGSISLLLTSFSASMLIVSKSDKIKKKTIKSLYIMSGIVAILGGIITAMSSLQVGNTLEISESLSMLLLSMTAVFAALSYIGPSSEGAASGALAMIKVITILGALMIGIGALVDNFPCLETFLNKGIGLLNGIASGIGEFVGNLIGGIGEGIMDHVPAIGKSLAEFAENISKVDPSVAESAKALAETLLILGGAELVDAIASFASKIFGNSSMTDFGDQLKGFAQGIVDFSDVIKKGKVNGDKIKGVAEAVKKIVEISQMIPNSGGLLGKILGNNDIDDFGDQLKGFGQGIVDFSNVIKKGKVKSDKIKDAADAVKKIVEIAQMIPNSGGLLGKLAGNNDIDDFGNKLSSFGQGIVDFSNVIKKGKVKSDKIKDAADAVKKIVEIAQIIPNSGGLLGKIAGNNDIDKFGNKLSNFGQGIVDFSNVIKKGKIKSGKIKDAADAIKKVIQIADMLPNSSIATISSKTIKKVCKNIKQLTNITALMKKMNANNIKSLPKEFSNLSKISINGFISNFKNSKSKVVSAINTTLNSAISTIKSKHSSFYSSGSYCVEGFVSGIMNKVNSGNIYGAGRKIGDEALKGARKSLDIRSPSRKMKEVAKYTVDGFVNYIKGAGANKVSASSRKMANTHTKTFNKTINKGIKKNSSSANKTIKSQGNKTVKTVSKVADSVLSAWKKKLKSAKKYYNKYIKDVTKHTSKGMTKFINSGTKPTKVEKYASGAMESFAREYLKTTEDVMVRSSEAAKAISGFVKALYMESDAYKEDQSNLKNLYKEQKKLYAKRISLYKKLSKTKDKKKRAEYKKQLKELNKEIASTNKKIKNQQKTIAKNIKKAYQEYIKGLKESIKSFTDITKITKETINLFDTSVLDTLESTGDGFDDLRESVTDSMKSMVSVLDVTLDTGVDILEEFKDSTEDTTNAIAEAEQELADATKDVGEAQNEYNEAQKELIKWQNKSNSVFGRSQRYLDKIKEAQEKLTEAQNKLTEATNKQIEANENLNALKTDTSVTDMLSNMKNNVDRVKDFRKDIDELAKRGLDDGLLQYLKDLGVSGAETIKTFTKMTDEQLKEAAGYFKDYNSLSSKSLIDGFEEKSKAMLEWGDNMQKLSNLNLDTNVKKALLSEFQEQGVDSSEYLKTIINMTDAELKQFNEDYLKMLKVPEEVANTVTEAQKKVDEANKQNSTATADTYIATMKANIELQKSYDKNLAELKNRVNDGIISEDFYEYIKEQGIESNDMISEFLRSSDDKLKEASKLYAESAKISGDKFIESYKESITDSEKWGQAITALSKLDIPNSLREELIKQAEEEGPDSLEWLDTLLGFTPSQWKKYVAAWKKRNKDMSQIPKDIAAAHAKTQYEKDHPYKTGIISSLGGEFIEAETSSMIETGTKHIEISLDKAHGKLMKLATSNACEGAKHVSEQAISTLSNGMSETKTADIGKSSCKGLSKGLKGNVNTVKDSAYNVASVIVDTIKNKLSELNDINLISGLSRLSTTSNNMHKAAKSSAQLMKKAIVKVASAGNSNTVSTPTIRPVIDMSSAKTSISHMKGMLSSNAINTNAALASDVARSSASRKGLSQNESTTNNYDSSQHTIENHFNITGDNPREIANEVSRIIQNQINRRSATWV